MWRASRLTPRQQAQRELAQALPRMAESFPRLESGTATAAWLDQVNPTPVVVPLRDEVTSGIARTLWMLAAAAGLVLLVAWANVANLLLIRADGRQLELAVREALGASRLRIATHFMGESIVLTAAAAAVALARGVGGSPRAGGVRSGRCPSSRGVEAGPNDGGLRRCDFYSGGGHLRRDAHDSYSTRGPFDQPT